MKQKLLLPLLLVLLTCLGVQAQGEVADITFDAFGGDSWSTKFLQKASQEENVATMGNYSFQYKNIFRSGNALIFDGDNPTATSNGQPAPQYPAVLTFPEFGKKVSRIELHTASDMSAKNAVLNLYDINSGRYYDTPLTDTPMTTAEPGVSYYFVIPADKQTSLARYQIRLSSIVRTKIDYIKIFFADGSSSLKSTGLAFSSVHVDAVLNQTFTPPVLTNPYKLEVDWTSSNPSVATVTGGKVTILGVGTTYISASYSETDVYMAGTVTYKLTVINPLSEDGILWDFDHMGWNGGQRLSQPSGSTYADEANLTSLTFISTADGKATVNYGQQGGYVVMNVGTSIIVKANKGYLIKKVEFVKAEGRANLTNATILSGGGSLSVIASGNAIWDLSADPVASGQLQIDKQCYFSKLIIYLAVPRLPMSADAVQYMVGTKNITALSNVKFGDLTSADTAGLNFTYESNNQDVVSVENSGKGALTFNAKGQAEITVSFAGNEKYAANSVSFIVNVTSKPTPVISFQGNVTSYTLGLVGNTSVKTINLKNLISSLTAEQKGNLKFEVPAGNNVVTIDQTTGEVTAANPGDVRITVILPETSDSDQAEAYVNVKVVDDRVAPEISFANAIVNVYTNETGFPGTLTMQSLNGSDGLSDIKYSLSGNIGTLDGNTITLSGNTGTGVLTATVPETATYLGTTASYKIVVANPFEGIGLNPSELTAAQGATIGKIDSDTKLVSFTTTSTVMQKNSTPVSVYQRPNGTMTITAADGYVIDNVVFDYSSTTAAKYTDKAVVVGSLADNKWSFTGINEKSATITNTGEANVTLNNVIVTLRRQVFLIKTDLVSTSVKLGLGTFDAGDKFYETLNGEILVNAPVKYSVWTDNTFTTESTLATVDEAGIVSLNGIGDVVIRASFDGNDQYAATTPAYFTLHISEADPVVITFSSEAQKLNMFNADDQILADGLITSIKIGDNTLTAEELLAKGSIGFTATPTEAVSIVGDKITPVVPTDFALQADKSVQITATFTPNDENKTDLAISKSSFNVVLYDGRQLPTFAFDKQYTYDIENDKTFVAPKVGFEYAEGTLVWTSSNDNAFIKDNEVVLPTEMVGIKNVTITATFSGDINYKPATGSYAVQIIGSQMTVTDFVNADPAIAAGDVIDIRGYIVGAPNRNNGTLVTSGTFENNTLAISPEVGNTTDLVYILLDGNLPGLYNLNAHPEYLGCEVEIKGNAGTVATRMGINKVTSILIYKKVNLGVSESTVNEGEPFVVTGIPADFPGDINYVVNGSESNIVANGVVNATSKNITIDGIGHFTIVFSTNGNVPGYAQINQEVPVLVVGEVLFIEKGKAYISNTMLKDGRYYTPVNEGAEIKYTINGVENDYNPSEGIALSGGGEITFTAIGADGANIPAETYVYDTREPRQVNMSFVVNPTAKYSKDAISYQFKSGKTNTVYTLNKDGEEAWAPMTQTSEVGFDKAVWSASIDIPQYEWELWERVAKNARAKAPVYDNPDPKNMVYLGQYAESSYFNITFGTETNGNVLFEQAPVAYTGEEIPALFYATGTDVYTDLYVINADDDSLIGTLPHSNNSWEVNLWLGDINLGKVTGRVNFYFATTFVNNRPDGTIIGALDPNGLDITSDVYKKNARRRADAVQDPNSNLMVVPTGETPNPLYIEVGNDPGTDKTFALKVELRKAGAPVYNDKGELTGNTTTELYQAGAGEHVGDIETIVWEAGADDADVMWFNLQGERIAEPSEGIVIRVQGNKSQKVLIRK